LLRVPIQKPHSYYDNTDNRKRKNEKPTLVHCSPKFDRNSTPKKYYCKNVPSFEVALII